MGKQEAFARTEVARFVTSNTKSEAILLGIPHSASRIERSTLDACSFEVPGRGLEPLRISPPDPKSGASANFATLALLILRNLCLRLLVLELQGAK